MASQEPPCSEGDDENGPVVGDDKVPSTSELQISWSAKPHDAEAPSDPDTTALKQVENRHETTDHQAMTCVSQEPKQQLEEQPELINTAATGQEVFPTSQTPGQLNLVGCTNVNITYFGNQDNEGSKVEPPARDDPNDATDGIDPYNGQIRIKVKDHRPTASYRQETRLPEGNPLSLILIGKTGNGKSATGNTIFCKVQLFKSSASTSPETQTCQMDHGIVGGREIYLVDTPGNMDPKKPKQCLHDIGSAIFLRPDGYDAIILALKHGSRVTPEEQKAIEQLQRLFGKDIFHKHAVIVFTNGDTYYEDMPFTEFVKHDADDFLEKLLVECKHRFLLFDNKITKNVVIKYQSVNHQIK